MSLLFLSYQRYSPNSPEHVSLIATPIATALVDNVFDFCNPLLPNIASKDIAKLQRVQYCLARVVSQSPRFSRPVPRQKSLHCLPVRFCITFKICTITYQTLPSKQPSYLLSMLPTAQTALIVKLKFTCCYQSKDNSRNSNSNFLNRHLLCGIHFLTTLNQK